MKDKITERLAQALQPVFMEIVNDSARHAGHAGDNGSGESHFRVTVVSAAFTGKGRIERQRIVYGLMKEELESGALHAFSVSALSPDEYAGM